MCVCVILHIFNLNNGKCIWKCSRLHFSSIVEWNREKKKQSSLIFFFVHQMQCRRRWIWKTLKISQKCWKSVTMPYAQHSITYLYAHIILNIWVFNLFSFFLCCCFIQCRYTTTALTVLWIIHKYEKRSVDKKTAAGNFHLTIKFHENDKLCYTWNRNQNTKLQFIIIFYKTEENRTDSGKKPSKCRHGKWISIHWKKKQIT